MSWTATAVALSVLALAGCGGDDDAAAPASAGTDLRVTVRAEGSHGEAVTDTLHCGQGGGSALCRRLTAEQLARVPADVACTQVFGGPATARVEGTLHGRPVDARFDLTNGCEIDRWRRNAALLGQLPGDPPGR